jgi:hypothetical protein
VVFFKHAELRAMAQGEEAEVMNRIADSVEESRAQSETPSFEDQSAPTLNPETHWGMSAGPPTPGRQYTAMNVTICSLLILSLLSISYATVSNAAPLDNWHPRTSGTTSDLRGIAHGNNTFVAVGNNGTILTSPDRTTWTKRTAPTTNHLGGVTYQNSVFFALGAGGLLLSSTNGMNWELRTLPPAIILYDLVYAKNKYVLVGDFIATSSDAITWTKGPQFNPQAYTIAFGKNVFLYGGEIGDIQSSTDGISWTQRLTVIIAAT